MSKIRTTHTFKVVNLISSFVRAPLIIVGFLALLWEEILEDITVK